MSRSILLFNSLQIESVDPFIKDSCLAHLHILIFWVTIKMQLIINAPKYSSRNEVYFPSWVAMMSLGEMGCYRLAVFSFGCVFFLVIWQLNEGIKCSTNDSK